MPEPELSAAPALSAGGPLAAALPAFRPRASQQAMATAIEQALRAREVLLCEAGTGTGKTFAYLVPVLLSGLKVIVSTGTRALQDQLIQRDLPRVVQALGRPVRAAVLKGRANYLCLNRLQLALGQADADPALASIQAWSESTVDGDLAELPGLPEAAPVRGAVTSTRENCLGQSCPQYDACHVVKARREAAAADLLVINHHLFLADMVLRGEGFTELLPGADAFILDEAHQLPDLAGDFLGVSLSGRQLVELARDVLRQAGERAGELAPRCAGLEQATALLRSALGAEGQRMAWSHHSQAATPALQAVDAALEALQSSLKEDGEEGPPGQQCRQRCAALRARLALFREGEEAEGAVSWMETRGRGFGLYRTPVEIAAPFRQRMQEYASAWVFVSATLAVGEDFSHFAGRLGLLDAPARRWDSPFDFQSQTLLYLPPMQREPGAPGYTREVVQVMREVIACSRGRAFLLFTSHRALSEAEALLRGGTGPTAQVMGYPLLVQGTAPHNELLARFRAHGNAVLLGTGSFWEGVDVRGEALSCVVIDKLPFAPPGDPVIEARSEALRAAGRNPFRDYHLPEAVLALKQGMGRLIRDEGDRGVLVLCDPRLRRRSYGRVFLRSLPAMPQTDSLQAVQAFFAPGGGG